MFLNYFSSMDNWRFFKLNGVKIGLFLTVILMSGAASAFDFTEATRKMQNDLNKGDSAAFVTHFLPQAQLHHLGDEAFETITLNDFTGVLKKFKNGEYREDFTEITVTALETGLTYVDVAFTFYINEKVAFSGVDHVVWVPDGDTYRIASLFTGTLKPQFTRATDPESLTGQLDNLMNKWHRDVAEYKLDEYFGFMTNDFIFLGTDPAERWTKEEFLGFCKPYFEKKSTWDFKTNWRNWYLNEDKTVAWFEESLDTWMEECRGSGVLVLEKGTWKIAHYNLSVLIENDKIKSFIKLRQK